MYAAFEQDEEVVLVLEHATGGDLHAVLERHAGRLPERLIVQAVLLPLLKALEYLHLQVSVHHNFESCFGEGLSYASMARLGVLRPYR